MKSFIQKLKTISFRPAKMLMVLFVMFSFMATTPAHAIKVLMYYCTTDPWNGVWGGELNTLLTGLGYNVTVISVCAAGYNPAGDNWNNYDQVWDDRFVNAGSTCGNTGWDTFDANWESTAASYLQQCGNLYLLSENDGFTERTQGVGNFLVASGAVANTFSGCQVANTGNSYYAPGGTELTSNLTAAGTALLPGAPTQIVTWAMGGIPLTELNGTDVADWSTGWTDGNVDRSIASAWSGSAQLKNYTGCNIGKLFVIWDTSMWQGNIYVAPQSTITNTLFTGIAEWFGAEHQCVCTTPTFTNTPTNTYTATPTPTHTNTNTFTATYTSTPTNTFTATFTNTNTFTHTYTSTFTNTFTQTDTPTFTNTFTNTYTATDTSSPTNTFTNTDTPTFTSTFTNTDTPTPTDTPTDTSTPTNTWTPTFINTPTFTNTFTNTDTPTVTNTPTNTFTMTMTDTNTLTPTPTFTFTLTPTFTPTNTFTATPTNTFTTVFTNTYTSTFTNTFTPTDTLTFTNTFTNTPTQTFTATFTSTFTLTPTPTSGISMGKNVSETQVHAGDTLTYTIGVTVVGNNIFGPVVTDTLPAYMTFGAFISSPAGTTTSFNSHTDQLQWNLPTLSPGIYDLTYTTQLGTFAPANMPLTNFAQLNYTGSPGPLTSSVPVTVIGNFTVNVNVYNSAGEIVKTITIQAFTQPINNITLSTTNTITTLSGSGSTINILYDGYVIGTWNGSNNSNQPVSNGNYSIQVDSVGTSGVVTSVSQTAIVNRSLSNITANVYNESGELVRTLYNLVSDPLGTTMSNVGLSANVIRPSLSAVSTNGVPTLVSIYIETSSTPVTLTWDGTNNSSSVVTPGIYNIEVHWNNGSGQTTDVSRQIMVIENTTISGITVAKPNVLGPNTTMTTTFDANGVLNAAGMKIRIYTVTGELVQTLTSSTPTQTWNASGLASGIYIANVELDNANSGVIGRQFLKILVLH